MWKPCFAALVLVLAFSGSSSAHFGMVIPSEAIVESPEHASVSLELSFSHPMEMTGMPLARPRMFQVIVGGRAEDLGGTLQPAEVLGHEAWKAQYAVKKPGVYQFVMEPMPYWEPAEDRFILHYAKTYMAAFGEEEGWDEPAGLKTEIVPLTRPFGNYAGSVFCGRVLLDGKPVPGAEVEMEYYNRRHRYTAPNAYMMTQTVRADDNGVFVCGIPFAGWWGFAALSTSPEKMSHDGEPKDVELGAVLWVEFVAPLAK